MNFETTKLSQYFYQELFYLAYQLDMKCKLIFKNTQPVFPGPSLQNDPDTHNKITSLLNDAAGISRLISTPQKKGKGENDSSFALRVERARSIELFLGSIEISEIRNRKVRNSVEHFDEYLDDINYKFSNSQFEHPPIAYNLIISDWEVYHPRLFPIKLYVVSERKYYNMHTHIDIDKIHKEAMQILEVCRASGLLPQGPPMGLFPQA